MTPLDPALRIRPAVDADGPAMADLIRSVFAEYDDCPFVPEEFPELEAPATHYGPRKGGVLWVVERKGPDGSRRIVGSLAVTPHAERYTFELFKVYVAADERGQGLSARLLGDALTYARERGGRRMVLWSDTRFKRGHAFYRKHGFRQLPGIRALHDVGRSFEYAFARDIGQA